MNPGKRSYAVKWDAPLNLGESRTGFLCLTTTRDVITALVPFIMICGDFSDPIMANFQNLRLSLDTNTVRMCEEEQFLTAFTVRTSDHHIDSDLDVTSISHSLVAQRQALAPFPIRNAMGMGVHGHGFSQEVSEPPGM